MVSRAEEASKCPPLRHIDLTAVALAVDHELTCTVAAASRDIELIEPDDIENAFARMLNGDVRYRFVIRLAEDGT